MKSFSRLVVPVKRWAPHIFAWVSVFFFWYQYYEVVDPPQVVVVNAVICTAFACIAFYLAYLVIAPLLVKHSKPVHFAMSVAAAILVLAALRSSLIYLNFEVTLPGSLYWEPFRSITTSAFHILYVITVATVVRLVAEQYIMKQHLTILEKEKLGAELQYLRNQVNPHFLFNVHNNINFLIHENPGMASRVIVKLSEVMRYQLYDCRQEWVTVHDEAANIANYLELERIRTEDAIEVRFEQSIQSGTILVAPFVLMTLIENAFKHVGRPPGGRARIEIALRQQGGSLVLTVSNDARPRDTWQATGGSGIGLDNLKKRLRLIYGDAGELAICHSDTRFDVSLKLPLR